MKSTTYKTFAILSCVAPIPCASISIVMAVSLAGKNFAGKSTAYIAGFYIGQAIVAFLPLVAGIVFGIIAASGVRAHGRKGLLLPAVFGMAFNSISITVFLIGFFSVLGRVSASPPNPAVAGTETSHIENRDYQISLDVPGPGWKLIPGVANEGMGPESAAGAMSPSLLACTVAVESTNIPEPRDYAQAVVEAVALSSKSNSYIQTLDFQGYKAARFSVQGESAGRFQRFAFLVFLRDSFGFRLFCLAPPGVSNTQWNAETEQFLQAFRALPGTVKRPPSAPRADFIGIGYQFQGGQFDSVSGQFSIDPAPGFQLVMPHQLLDINPDAEAGLVAQDQSLSLVIITEHIGATDPKDFAAQVRTRWNNTLKKTTLGVPVSATIDSNTFELYPYTGAEAGVDNRLGIFVNNSIAYQINAWYPSSGEAQAFSQLTKALSAIHIKSPSASSELAQTLANQGADNDYQSGNGASFRNGLYRHYSAGLSWIHPSRGFLRILLGAQAEKRLRGAEIYFEDRSINLHGYAALEALGASTSTPNEYHKNLITNTIKTKTISGLKSLPPLTWGAASAHVSTFLSDVGALRLRYWMASARVDSQGYSCMFWMPDSLADQNDGFVKAILQGFAVASSPYPESFNQGNEFIHHRMGFRFESPPGFSFQDERAPGDGTNVARLAWLGPGQDSVRVVAIVAPDRGQPLTFALKAMEQKLRETMNVAGTPKPSTLDGQAAKFIQGPGLAAYFTTKHNVIYGVIASSSDETPERFANGFHFLTE